MVQDPPFWMWIAGFLLVLGPLVTLHELGHYLVGRWFGVKADAFSIGFGKELTGWTDKRGTRWKLSAIPLGGYVQFAGDMNATSQPSQEWLDLPEEERARTFQSKSLGKRALIVAAGPMTNLLIAVAIFAGFNLVYGKPLGTPVVAQFAAESPGREAGLKIGDKILEIDGHDVENQSDLLRYVVPYPDTRLSVTVDRDGSELNIPVRTSGEVVSDEFGNKSRIGDFGVRYSQAGFPMVSGFTPQSPAKAAGVEVGDRIVGVNGEKVATFSDLVERIGARPDSDISLTIVRDGQPREFALHTLSEAVKDNSGKAVATGRIGVVGGIDTEVLPVGPVEAVTMALGQTWETMRMMVDGIVQIVTGKRSVKELGGPVKIAKFSGEQLSLGPIAFVIFAALISLNLAFINLLPIPALDGGHLAFYAAEAIRRRPASQRSQEWAFRTGIAFVLALMLFVTINDIASLPFFGG